MLTKSYTKFSSFQPCNYKFNTCTNINLPSIKNLPLPNFTQIKLPPIVKQQHTLVQSQELRFKCSKCIKSFKRKNSLIRHERVHTGIKPFLCRVCNKKFTRKDILESHKMSMKCRKKTQISLNNKELEEADLNQIEDNISSSSSEDSRRTSIASLIWSNESLDYDTGIDYWSLSPTQSNANF